MVFMLAGSIVAPLAIGTAFQLAPAEIAGLMQRTFFIVGLASLLQVLFGHKLPAVEGPAGLWWGIFIVYAGLVSANVLSVSDGLAQLQLGMMISGLLFVILGILRWMDRMKRLFTPLVVGTYLLLLVAQLSGSFIQGMLGVGYLADRVDLKVAIPALSIFVLAIILSRSSLKILRNYSVLISLFVGWLLFIALGIDQPTNITAQFFSIPQLLAWGSPQFSSGMMLTSVFIGLLLLANMIASTSVVEKVLLDQNEHVKKVNYNRTSLVMGVNTSLAGLFSAIGCVPISASAGFMLTTKIVSRLPFIIAAILMTASSFFPVVTSVLASIPMPVGYATIFVSFAGMIGIGLKEYQSLALNEKQLFIIGISLMVGLGSLFVPAETIVSLPAILQTVVNNGLVLGTVTCIVLEQGMGLISRKLHPS